MFRRSDRELLENLAKLKPIHVQVLYHRCKGKNVGDIVEILSELYPERTWIINTIRARFTNIYNLLDIKGEDKEKEDKLIFEYCPTFSEFVKFEDDWERWGDIRLEILRKAAELYKEERSSLPLEFESPKTDNETPLSESTPASTTEEKQTVIDPPSTTQPSPPSESQQEVSRKREGPANIAWPLIAVPLLILCVLCVSAVPFVWRIIWPMIGNAIPLAQATRPEATIQDSFITHQPADTAASLPSNTPLPVVVQTSLPTSTHTAVPPTSTSTPTETMQPTPSNLFETSFEKGLPTGIELVYGEVNFVNEKLVAQDSALLAIGDNAWKNYQVEYETKKHTYCWYLKNNGVAAHANDPDNMIMWSWNYCESAWFELENGNWIQIEGSHQGNVANPGTTITIRLVAEDGNFNIYINNKKKSSYYDGNYLQGKVYILLSRESVVDNIRISPLP